MNVRGNYLLFYTIEFLTGILLIVLCNLFGDFGLIGLLIFFLALILTAKSEPDEREIFLTYKINNWESIVIGISMAVIYFYFPSANWFYALLSISLIARGIIGFLTFKFS